MRMSIIHGWNLLEKDDERFSLSESELDSASSWFDFRGMKNGEAPGSELEIEVEGSVRDNASGLN